MALADSSKLTSKQLRFANEYLKDLNATRAIERCGFGAKNPVSLGQKYKQRPAVAEYIAQRLEEMNGKAMADQEEVLGFFTKVMRNDIMDQTVTPSGKVITSKPGIKDRLRAAEALAKYFNLFTDRAEVKVEGPIIVENVPD